VGAAPYDLAMRRAIAGTLLLLLAGPAAADTKPPHREGDYGGVTPGEKPEKPKKKPAPGTLSWVGFEARNGGAKVFFQSPGVFEVTQRVEGSTLVVHLNLQRLAANAGRAIDTRFFDNPLSGIRAARKRNGIEVRINFKNPKDARAGAFSTKTEADGFYYVYLTFPEGSAQPGGTKNNDLD
jgi:hypothetical protein